MENAEREGLKQRIQEMREFLNNQPTEITGYDELLVRRLIEKVTVYEDGLKWNSNPVRRWMWRSKWNIKDVAPCGFGIAAGRFFNEV